MRSLRWLAATALCCLLFLDIPAHSLQPSTQITQYGHTAWRFEQSGLDSVPTAIAQTTDGYLWVATIDGLFQFDGSHFHPWKAAPGERLPGEKINALLASRDGSLYMASQRGVTRLRHGHLYLFPDGAKSATSLLEDAQGGIWVGQSQDLRGSTAVCKVGEKTLSCIGAKDGLECKSGYSLASNPTGSVWVGSQEGVCRLQKDEPPQNILFRSRSKMLKTVLAIASDRQGNLWAGIPDSGRGAGLLRFSDGAWRSYVTPEVDGSKLKTRSLLFDHDDNLWIGTSAGLDRLSQGRLDHFDTKGGLSGNWIRQIFEDREHTLWVVTDQGVDSFRDLPVISFAPMANPDITMNGIVATSDGTLWVGSDVGLWRLQDGHFFPVAVGEIRGVINYLFVDSRGRFWVSEGTTLYLYDGHQFATVMKGDKEQDERVIAMEEDNRHQVWASVSNLKFPTKNVLVRVGASGPLDRFFSPVAMDHQVFNILAPSLPGGLWVGGYDHGLYRVQDGQTEEIKPIGLETFAYDMTADGDGALWIGVAKGAIRYLKGKSKTLDREGGLPCNAVLSVVDDHAGSHWFFTPCGISRIEDRELIRWWEGSIKRVQATSFTPSDGAHSQLYVERPFVASDSRIWSVNANIVQMIDPRHLPINHLPPPVQIEQLMVNHKNSPLENGLKLPVSPREVQIDYAGLSYVVPEKVQFRYQLIGYDKGWTDAGARRQAFYNDLAPGRYTFRVIACNNDGVWNMQGAALAFTVPPAWFQTLWFRLLCVVLATALVYFIYALRMRQYASRMKMRFNERLDERTRLARDLHDTLMQTIQGSRIVAENAHESTRDLASAKSALALLSEWLSRATLEGRAALDSLRSSTIEENDLAASFRHSFDNYIKDDRMTVNVCVSGKSKEMHPIARDEVYRIGDEAIRNACLHSGGTRVDIDLVYDQNMQLRVRDDGKGIDAETLEAGKTGHYGLTGMRERADRIGATLSLESSSQGTEIALSVPGKAIYQPPSAQIKRLLKGKNGASNAGGSH